MSFYNKKDKEREVAEFFANWLNTSLKTNYKAIPDSNDKDMDYILESEKFENKYLQLINCDSKEIIDLFLKSRNMKGFTADKEIKLDKIIKFAIKLKSEKYSKDVKKLQTLIVWNNFIKLHTNKNNLEKEMENICNQTDFKEIYYLTLPDNSAKNSAPENNGQIIQLR